MGIASPFTVVIKSPMESSSMFTSPVGVERVVPRRKQFDPCCAFQPFTPPVPQFFPMLWAFEDDRIAPAAPVTAATLAPAAAAMPKKWRRASCVLSERSLGVGIFSSIVDVRER
jgi:hypothetical protein